MSQQARKATPLALRTLAVIGIHVLAQERDLAHAGLHKQPRLPLDLDDGARIFSTARVRHNAEGTELVATFLHGDKSRSSVGFRFRQRIEFLFRREVGLQGMALVAREPREHFRNAVIGLGPDHQVHRVLAADDFLTFGLRHAARDGD